jgi:hypothetical protein
MKKSLVRVETKKLDVFYDLSGNECASRDAAEFNSKRHLLPERMRQVNIVMDEEKRNFVARIIIGLEDRGVVSVLWDDLLNI